MPVEDPERRKAWFKNGHAALTRSFPHAITVPPLDTFYVCPLCLQAFGDEALKAGFLTREHVPPMSVGGKRVVLTCKDCNSDGGSEVDDDMSREVHLHDFARGDLNDLKTHLQSDAGRVPVRLSINDDTIRLVGVPQAVDPVIIRA